MRETQQLSSARLQQLSLGSARTRGTNVSREIPPGSPVFPYRYVQLVHRGLDRFEDDFALWRSVIQRCYRESLIDSAQDNCSVSIGTHLSHISPRDIRVAESGGKPNANIGYLYG